ncbi:MAG: hypothetical protein R3F33_04960 [Planctomycetota bacterium]
MDEPQEPWPAEGRPVLAETEALRAALERAQAGLDFKSNKEILLKDLLPDVAEQHLMVQQEGRGAWTLMLPGAGGEALFVGNALSGTIQALARIGYRVCIADTDPERLAWAALRDAALIPGRTHGVRIAGDGPPPFQPASFDLVVLEPSLPGNDHPWAADPRPWQALTRDLYVRIADNPWAYKNATGVRGRFRIQSPVSWLQSGLAPAPGAASRAQLRRETGDFAQAETVALYPHRLECSHVVHLDQTLPRLTVGTKERRNLLKVVGHRLGAFPRLTPSLAVLASRQRGPARLHQALRELQTLGFGPLAEHAIEHLIATRGNLAVVHTLAPDGEPGVTLHVPLCAHKRRLIELHYRALQELSADANAPRVPRPIFCGEAAGLWLSVEERLPGISAPQLLEGSSAQIRLFSEVGRALPGLARGPRRVLDAPLWQQWLAPRFDRAIRLCGRNDTARNLRRMVDESRERMLGQEFQPVLYHADLRPKHAQAQADGSLVGLMDWGAYEPEFLPLVDLLHLVLHRRHAGSRAQWRALLAGGLTDYENQIIDGYCRDLGVTDDLRSGIAAMYPALTAGMAERNWEFSRPYWVHRIFGL